MAVCSFCSSSVWSEWEFVYSLVVYCLWVASPVLVLDCSSPAVWCFLVATTLGVGVTWAGVWRSMLIHRRAVNKAKQCNSCVWISSFFSCIYLFVNVRVTGADLFYNFFLYTFLNSSVRMAFAFDWQVVKLISIFIYGALFIILKETLGNYILEQKPKHVKRNSNQISTNIIMSSLTITHTLQGNKDVLASLL